MQRMPPWRCQRPREPEVHSHLGVVAVVHRAVAVEARYLEVEVQNHMHLVSEQERDTRCR